MDMDIQPYALPLPSLLALQGSRSTSPLRFIPGLIMNHSRDRMPKEIPILTGEGITLNYYPACYFYNYKAEIQDPSQGVTS